MTPRVAEAGDWPSEFVSGKVYFLYEDHIGRPVALSEYEDYDEDGSYFTDEEDGDPFFQAAFNPFGSTYEDFDSKGITIGDPGTTGITWAVPFRFPGQYEDPEISRMIKSPHRTISRRTQAMQLTASGKC